MAGPALAAVARHEAAHAAMALMLGRRVERLSIDDDGSGLCAVSAPSYGRTRDNHRRAIRENLVISIAADLVERADEAIPGWWRL